MLKRTVSFFSLILLAASVFAGGQTEPPESVESGREILKVKAIWRVSKAAGPHENCLFNQEMKKRFGLDIEWEHVDVSEMRTKMPLLFASGDYPAWIKQENKRDYTYDRWGPDGYMIAMNEHWDELPNYRKLYAPLIESGKKVIFVSDGNYTEFIDDIAATGISGFFFEPLTDLEYITEHYGQTHIIIGNADTRILLMGTREDIRREVERCIELGRSCPGYFMSVTNMIPANTPVENALYYNEVYEELSHR